MFCGHFVRDLASAAKIIAIAVLDIVREIANDRPKPQDLGEVKTHFMGDAWEVL